MTFRVGLHEEPLLEFGGNGREIDIRLGLRRHGPLEPDRAGKVRLGIIVLLKRPRVLRASSIAVRSALTPRKAVSPTCSCPFQDSATIILSGVTSS